MAIKGPSMMMSRWAASVMSLATDEVKIHPLR
jgi:hypothetical protein